MTNINSNEEFKNYLDNLGHFSQIDEIKVFIVDLEIVTFGKRKIDHGPGFLLKNRYEEYRKYFAKTINARNCKRDGESDFSNDQVRDCMKNGKYFIILVNDFYQVIGFCIFRVVSSEEWNLKTSRNQTRVASINTNQNFVLQDVLYIDLICSTSGYGKKIIQILNEIGKDKGCNALGLNSVSRSYDFYVKQRFKRTNNLKVIYPSYDQSRRKYLLYQEEVDDGYYFMIEIT